MSLANGRTYLAIPGPSVVPDAVLRAMHRASPNIYAGELPDMMPGLVRDLKRVARTKGHAAIYISNGHGAWEAALANTVAAGEKVLVLATGFFAKAWSWIAEARGIDVDLLDFGNGGTFDLARVKAALKADSGHAYKAVLAVHVDTSSSNRNEFLPLRQILDDLDHPALLMADCIASMACDRFEMDAWGVDVTVTGSQKGLMCPPGLGFVFFNEKAAQRRKELKRVSTYWDWTQRAAPEAFYQYFSGTAPTHHIYGLRTALDMIQEEGMEAIWARHATLARAIWAAVEHWGQDGPLRLNIADPALRSHAVTAMSIGKPFGAELRRWCAEEAGVTLGIGLGMENEEDPNSDGYFRFGHMGHVNAHMVLGLLGVVEAGLGTLKIPHRPGGVSEAVKVISGV
ncbi:aminotransferase class V-fold PLP-dependent enzyme [Marivita sp. XM-24bin2]|jgi:alanine-glyoxylate transaminase/serine-glyoxylate transaminase/serine-pyruvate transaminase|uniref:pyridoxal-phosphate-dependent aminotransferase family protein n=1 Tax=unclassified Marivita TaxID=2632480 RepID=UPI000D78E888|nr:aminotransferase class V-fold PLP-dependent enzyme [Marivita sp. XM-24bin2]MCR9108853.1 aminotransferase class V-fold PLP-dependent enzyme [Paracoccaceae bacterium]PWL34910.1 MAG: aminotransferase [Marivita sp. XM-24bin2]